MFNIFSSATNAYKSLNGPEFKGEFSKSSQPVLIDVRTSAEFATGSIAGAKNIDIMSPDFQKKIEALDKAKDYFLFCRSGNRSAQACSLMGRKGIESLQSEGRRGRLAAIKNLAV